MLPAPAPERGDAFWLRATRDIHVATAAAFGIIVVRDPLDHARRIRAGRLWQRMHLWGVAHGLGMQPLNQAPERADREASAGLPPRFGRGLQDLIGSSNWVALMPFRVGYPRQPALPSPRRAISDVLL